MKTNLHIKTKEDRAEVTRLLKLCRKGTFLLYGYYSSSTEFNRWCLERNFVDDVLFSLQGEFEDLKEAVLQKIDHIYVREVIRAPHKMFELSTQGKSFNDIIDALLLVGEPVNSNILSEKTFDSFEEKINNLNKLKTLLDN